MHKARGAMRQASLAPEISRDLPLDSAVYIDSPARCASTKGAYLEPDMQRLAEPPASFGRRALADTSMDNDGDHEVS